VLVACMEITDYMELYPLFLSSEKGRVEFQLLPQTPRSPPQVAI